MQHLLPSLRSNQEPQMEVVLLVLTPRKPVSQLPRKATPNPGTVGATTRENTPTATTTIIDNPTLQPPLAILLRDSRRMVTSPLRNVIVDAATTSVSTAESLDTSTVIALAIPVQPSITPVVPERDPVMLLQPRPNQPTNATAINIIMVATAIGSRVKGTLGEPPSPSQLLTHQQNPQFLHLPHLAWETRWRPSRSRE